MPCRVGKRPIGRRRGSSSVLGAVGRAFFVYQTVEIVHGAQEINGAATKSASAAIQFKKGAEQIVQAAQEQARAVEEAAKAIDEQNRALNDMSAGADELAQMSETLETSTVVTDIEQTGIKAGQEVESARQSTRLSPSPRHGRVLNRSPLPLVRRIL